jgi:hypothetical protein
LRDSHQGYPEILATYERDGLYFGVVRVTLADDSATFEFGVDHQGHGALKRILQTRPFDEMAGVVYRYFFTGRYSRKTMSPELVTIGVRIEEGTNAKNFDFDGPVSLVQNLRWFQSLSDFKEAAALKRIGS